MKPFIKIPTFLLAFLMFNSFSLSANGLKPQKKASLADHLFEINKEWLKYPSNIPTKSILFQNDTERIKTHLKYVLDFLKEKDLKQLSAEQIENRSRLLNKLKAYQEAGRFPKNLYHLNRQPYFIDDFGTACAVGYLLIEDGKKTFAERLRKENNYAYIHEMDYEELPQWAEKNGFTIDELALIQPGYPCMSIDSKPLDNNIGVEGEIKWAEVTNDHLILAGDFTAIEGQSASNIVAWDGSELIDLDGGICGEITAITTTGSEIFIGGQFDICNGASDVGIARWDGTNWFSMGSVAGTINTMIVSNGPEGQNLYVGGEFIKIDDFECSNLARFPINNSEWNNADGELAVNFAVNDIIKVDNRLLIGGAFTTLNSWEETDPDLIKPARYLAFWNYDQWDGVLDNDLSEVQTLGFYQGTIFVGGDMQTENSFAQYRTGEWIYTQLLDSEFPMFMEFGDNTVHGFIEMDSKIYAYGGIGPPQFAMEDCTACLSVNPGFQSLGSGLANFNGQINSITKYEEDWIIAGTFDKIGSTERNNIIITSLRPTSNTELVDADAKVFTAHDEIQIILDEEQSQVDAELIVYNLGGSTLGRFHLPKGRKRHSVDFKPESSGIIVYQLVQGNKSQAGKLSFFKP